MKFTTKLTNMGIELSLHEDDIPKPLEPEMDANQKNPRGYYVYAHLDSSGRIFYVGKGKGGRAWSHDRHPLWHRYVEKHLKNEYQVRILQDNLLAEEAEEVEAAWIAQCSDTVVNWFNMGRETDFEMLNKRNKLRDENVSLIQQAKDIEKHDLERAVLMYIKAIEDIQRYAFITYEKGLVGQLLDEEAAELGVCGEINALERLSMCLVKLGRPAEAAKRVDDYFVLYRRDLQFGAAKRIEKRVSKALENIQKRVLSGKDK